jgi:hypothetical protein
MRWCLWTALSVLLLMVATPAVAAPITLVEEPDDGAVDTTVAPTHARCVELEPARLVVLYDPANPDLAWSDVLAAHGVSMYNPIVARSGLKDRGTGLVYAMWINRASEHDPPLFDTAEARSLDLCNFLHDDWERGDGGQLAQAATALRGLVPQLWCEQLRVQSGAPQGTSNPYMLALRDAFGARGDGMRGMLYFLTQERLGTALALSNADLGRQAAAGVLRTMDLAQCA